MSVHTDSTEPLDRVIHLRRGAKALVVRDGAVLVVKERHSDGTPFWTLPGGGIHPTESVTDALTRELREEIRCRGVVGSQLDSFVYVHQSSPTVTVYRVFECSIAGQTTPALTEGIYKTRWVSPRNLPGWTLPPVRFIIESCVSNSQ